MKGSDYNAFQLDVSVNKLDLFDRRKGGPDGKKQQEHDIKGRIQKVP